VHALGGELPGFDLEPVPPVSQSKRLHDVTDWKRWDGLKLMNMTELVQE
jgi:hypothetical protein